MMRKNRKEAIEKAANADKWGLILGTLGRQGSEQMLMFGNMFCWLIWSWERDNMYAYDVCAGRGLKKLASTVVEKSREASTEQREASKIWRVQSSKNRERREA